MATIEWNTERQVRLAYDAMRRASPDHSLPVFDSLDTATLHMVTQMWERGMLFGALGAAEKRQ